MSSDIYALTVFQNPSLTGFTCCLYSILGSCSDLMKVGMSTLQPSSALIWISHQHSFLFALSPAGCSYAGDSRH